VEDNEVDVGWGLEKSVWNKQKGKEGKGTNLVEKL
jgi:hypothetical protein